MKTLNELSPPDKARVTRVLTRGLMRRRFADIGLTVDTVVECVGESRGNDPKAFLIRGAVIAIRNCDTAEVEVEILNE